MTTQKIDKVYLVFQGEYSDRSVIGVFLDEKKAEKFAEIEDRVSEMYCGSTYVSDYKILDDRVDIVTPVNDYYFYSIDLDGGGDVYYDNDGDTEARQCSKESFHEITKWSVIGYSTRSLEHAKKIAVEQYQIHTQNEAVEKGEI